MLLNSLSQVYCVRYVAVCHPITAPSLRTPAICRVVTACTWLLSGAMMVPVMLFSSTVTSPLYCTVHKWI